MYTLRFPAASTANPVHFTLPSRIHASTMLPPAFTTSPAHHASQLQCIKSCTLLCFPPTANPASTMLPTRIHKTFCKNHASHPHSQDVLQAIREMQSRYPYAMKGQLFSKAIHDLVASPSYDIWVWNITCYPVNCSMLMPLYRVWEYSGSRLGPRCLCTLPTSIQDSVLLIACYRRPHNCKFFDLRGQCFVAYERMQQHIRAAPSVG